MAELTSSASSPECIFGTKAGSKSCKSPPEGDAGAISPLCPNCIPKVTKVYRDGLRYLEDGAGVQR
jgi:hypothetical protein